MSTVVDGIAWCVNGLDILYGFGGPLVATIFEFSLDLGPPLIFVNVVAHYVYL